MTKYIIEGPIVVSSFWDRGFQDDPYTIIEKIS